MPYWGEYQKACNHFCADHPSPVVFSDEDWGHVEHTLHEISHAVNLGISAKTIVSMMKDRLLSTAIGKEIPNANIFADDKEEQEEFALDQERETFCIEAICLDVLKVPVEHGELVDAAVVQGVPAKEMWDALDQPGYGGLAHKVLEVLDEYKSWVEEGLSPA